MEYDLAAGTRRLRCPARCCCGSAAPPPGDRTAVRAERRARRVSLWVGNNSFTRAARALQNGPRRLPSSYKESAQGARSCDLEGNRAGLGCLEHLRNALSFAVVTEWPVGVYPPRLPGSPPHVRRVRAVAIQPACVYSWPKIRTNFCGAVVVVAPPRRAAPPTARC